MKKFFVAMSIAAAGWLAAVPAQAAPLLSIVPSATSTTVGGPVSVDLVISGLTSVGEIVSGFDLDVFFDPAVLSASFLQTTTTPWGGSALVMLEQNFVAPGHVEFQLIALSDDATLAALQGDSFILSTIGFQGVADGFSNVNFGLDPDFERNVTGRRALSLGQGVQGTCIAVGAGSCVLAVPEPASVPLVLMALAAAGFVARRRPQAKQ